MEEDYRHARSLVRNVLHILGKTDEEAQEYGHQRTSGQYRADHRNNTSTQSATRRGRNTTVQATGHAARLFRQVR